MNEYSTWSSSLTLDAIRDLFTQQGCEYVVVKQLAERQDNDKNQIYVGKDLSAVSMIPSGNIEVSTTSSTKTGAPGKSKFQARLGLRWFTQTGVTEAQHAKLIYYPQYPEVRFSGFLRGTTGGPSDLLSRAKRGQEADRLLLIGVNKADQTWGLVLGWEATARSDVLRLSEAVSGPLLRWELGQSSAIDTRAALLDELERIHSLGWIRGMRLKDGAPVPYTARNGGGYTLEALLGISPNGNAEPDFLGWEIKQHGVKAFEKPGNPVITLMTPEPTAGVYVSPGFEDFMLRFGYPDKSDEARTNFGGIYKAHKPPHPLTGLRLALNGFQSEKAFDANGSVALIDTNHEVAAEWPFPKLMEHWKLKHAAACFVPSLSRDTDTGREYLYGRGIMLAGGASFGKLLRSIDGGGVYLDPALKLIVKPDGTATRKKRSQFRTRFRELESLYEWVDYYGPHDLE